MAETTMPVSSDVIEHPAPEPEKLLDYLPKPDASDAPHNGQTTQPQEIPMQENECDKPAPSKVIKGIFGNQATEQEKSTQIATTQNEQASANKERGGKPPKTENPDKTPEPEKPKKAEHAPRLPKGPKVEKQATVSDSGGGISVQSAGKEMPTPTPTPVDPVPPAPPKDATRPGVTEQIVYIAHADLHPFKGHPFQVRDDDAMKALIESVKERGVDQPALVRPREGGGYELVAGHRRQHASELAGYENVPCIVRNMTDDEAVLAMAESNFNQRAEILPSERAKALQMQLEAIKHQGAKSGDLKNGELGKRSNEVIADRNQMAVKQVQRYIALNNLVPDLLKLVDEKKIPFTPAVEMSYIKPKNQRYIAVAIEAQESAPSLAQSQRMRELDQKGILNGDVIDGIMLEEKKEETRVILNSQELGKYFGPEKSPRDMKDQILKLLDEWKDRQPELAKPEKKLEQEK